MGSDRMRCDQMGSDGMRWDTIVLPRLALCTRSERVDLDLEIAFRVLVDLEQVHLP